MYLYKIVDPPSPPPPKKNINVNLIFLTHQYLNGVAFNLVADNNDKNLIKSDTGNSFVSAKKALT